MAVDSEVKNSELSESAKLDLLLKKMDDNDRNMSEKVDAIDLKLSGLSAKLETIENNVKKNDENITALQTKQTNDNVRITNIETTLADYKKLIQETKDSCEFTSQKYELVKNHPDELNAIKQENVGLKKSLDDLGTQLKEEKTARNIEQQYHRTSLNIKLCGVPTQDYEDESISASNPITEEVIKRVCSAASIIFDTASIDVCHRMGNSTDDRPSPIIIRFKSKRQRNHFFDQKNKLKNIAPLDVDFSNIHGDMNNLFPRRGGSRGGSRGDSRGGSRGGDSRGGSRGGARSRDSRSGDVSDGITQKVHLSPIYMQEHLTKRNKDLLKSAKAKLNGTFKFPGYVKNGEVRAKREEESKFVSITCEEDIEKLLHG